MCEQAEDFLKVDSPARLDVHLAGQVSDRFGEAADGIDAESLDDGGLGSVGRWDKQAGSVLGGRLQGHGQDPFDGPGFAGQCQLADDRKGARPVEGDLSAAQQ